MDVREEGPREREREKEGGRMREVEEGSKRAWWSGREGNKTSETKRVARASVKVTVGHVVLRSFSLAYLWHACAFMYMFRARMYICMCMCM